MIPSVDFLSNIYFAAVGLHWVGQFEEQGNEGRSTAELDVNATILADLQQTQDKEFSNLLGNLFKKVFNNIVYFVFKTELMVKLSLFDSFSSELKAGENK
jgi:hypothetical protein